MGKEQFFLLIQKYLDGNATEDEKELLREWYDSFDDSSVKIPAGDETEAELGKKMLSRFRESLKERAEKARTSRTFVLKGKRWMGIAAILVVLLAGGYLLMQQKSTGHRDLSENMESEEEENDGYDGIDKAMLFEIERTKDPATGKVPVMKLWEAIKKTEEAKENIRQHRTESIQALAWGERGPNGDFTVGGNPRPAGQQTSGRIRAVMVDSTDPTHKTVWVGGVDGGLWKTTDITANPSPWVLVNDYMSNLAIAAICQDPRPGFQNNMYFCTGEAFRNADAVRGVGVFKSTDGGVTWNFLSNTSAHIVCTRIVCDFQGNVYLATRNVSGAPGGLYRSIDGGTNWTNITPTGVNASIGDLEISSTAVAGRLHMVTGIGTTQTYRYTDIPATVTSAAGWNAPTTAFPSFNERCEMACVGNVLYALPVNQATNNVPFIYKTTDGGDNWTATSSAANQPNAGNWASGQGWYALSCGINPSNTNEVIVGGLDTWKSINGGASWTQLSSWATGTTNFYVHADQHNIQWWDGGNKLLFACDGGIHFSPDGGTTKTDKNKGLRLKQFYSVAIHPLETNYFIGGAQDNGMHRLNHPGLDSSAETVGGDGCYAAIDQNQPQYQFGSYVYNVYRRTSTNGSSWNTLGFYLGTSASATNFGQFVNPWDYDNNTNILYGCGSGGTYFRIDNPQTLASGNYYSNPGWPATASLISVGAFSGGTVSAVHASPYTANRVFFGLTNGSLFMLDNANGAAPTATNITPAGASGYLNCVVTGSSDQNLMACYSSYNVNNVWVSTNGGTSWTACDNNLPNMPVRWGLFHPDGDTKSFIATETGVWETDLLNGAATVWVANTTFPTVRTDMIKYRASDRTIAAGTHGRGIWSAQIPAAGGFSFNSPSPAVATCPAPATMDIVLGTIAAGGFSNPITVSSSTPPAGTTVSFIPSNTVTPGNSVTVRLTGTNTLIAGSYTLTITGTATGAATQTRDITYTINPGAGPAITANPANQTVCQGNNVSFAIVSATATAFQWQLSTDGGANYNDIPVGAPYSGITTNTLNITGVTLGLSGNRYRCIASTQCGTTTSNAGILTVNPATAITAQPTNVSTCTGSSAQFCVTAVGTGLLYQWQSSTTGCGGPWANIPAATANCYTIPSVTTGQNNTSYQCIVTGTCAPLSVTSTCATLTVATTLNITGQPADVVACVGNNASFTVTATGATTYQWQLSTDGGANYNNIPVGAPYSGINTAILNITGVTAGLNGNRYRCNVGSASCGSATSNSALLTVNTLPTITTNPSDVTKCTGTNHTFSVVATGTGITYQWQISTDGGANYNNIPVGAPYSGINTADLTITGITAAMNNNRYRCIVTGTCPPPATSTGAILTVLVAVTINTNPVDQTVCEGTNVSFTVGAVGTAYQWQVSTDGGTNYNNIPVGAPYSGINTATLTITGVTPAMNGNRYRAVVTNGSCTPGISTGAILTVNTFPIITTQPVSVTICEGGNAGFTVTATTGVGVLTYQWQLSTDGGVNYNDIVGATTSSFAQTGIPATQNGYRFRVRVTAGCGSVISNVAILTVNALPVITFSLPATICLSDPALSLTASPTGGTFSGPGVSGVLFNPLVASLGPKTVTYTASNAGCQAAVSRTILVNECSERHLRLGDFMAATIYPNPNDGNFNIRINTDLYTKIGLKIYNSLGQLIKTQDFTAVTYGSVLQVHLFNPPNGVYHLYLYSDELKPFSRRSASIIVNRQ